MMGTMGRREELLNKVLSNTVVAETIMGFLHLTDMKMASEVSHTFLNMIRSTHGYQGRTLLKVCKESLEKDPEFRFYEGALSRGPRPWKGLILDLSEIRDWYGVNRVVDFLKKNGGSGIHTLKFIGGEEVDVQMTLGVLKELFSIMKEMNDFKIDLQFLRRLLPHLLNFVSEPEVLEILPSLRELEILSREFKNRPGIIYFPPKRGKLTIPEVYPGLDKLQVLKMRFDYNCDMGNVEVILGLIRANASTLEDLNLQIVNWDGTFIRTMREVHCQRLRRLSLTIVGSTDENDIVEFVKAQPLLQHLRLNYSPARIAATSLTWDMIKTRGKKLKSIHLQMKWNDVNSLLIFDDFYDWSFLSQLEELRDFSLTVEELEYIMDAATANEEVLSDRINHNYRAGVAVPPFSGVSFMKHLPPTVTKLKLNSLRNFWFDYDTKQTVVGRAQKASLISRFPHLTSLSLGFVPLSSSVGMEIDDHLTQHIIRHCKRLRKFELIVNGNRRSRLTEEAVTGTGTGDIRGGISLNTLKGLTELTLKGFDINAPAVIGAIAFPYLRAFEYVGRATFSSPSIFTATALVQLLNHNPCLETIRTWPMPIPERRSSVHGGMSSYDVHVGYGRGMIRQLKETMPGTRLRRIIPAYDPRNSCPDIDGYFDENTDTSSLSSISDDESDEDE